MSAQVVGVAALTAVIGLLYFWTAATSLERALREEQLVVVGALDDIVACHEGLIAYLHGATRAPSCRGLWRRFRCEFLAAES